MDLAREVLVSGITGFVGTNLLSFVESDDIKIHGLVRNRTLISDMAESGLTSLLTVDDLNSHEALSGYIHLAGKAHDLKNISDDQEYMDVNFGLTKILFDHFIENPVAKKFIFISSVKAVSDSPVGVLDETAIPAPATAYGRSKRMAEEYILNNCSSDKKVYILRPCMIHGPGNKGNLNLLYSLISRGLPWPLGAFENKRSFLTVENFCFVIHQLLSEDIESGIYHLSDSRPLSTNRLIELIAEMTGQKARIWHIPKGLVKAGAKLGNIVPLPVDEERLQKLTENYVVSNRKLIRALGTELPIEAENGLRSTLASFKHS